MINWNTRQLEVFVVVAEALSFRRAAELVHLSQPAVSGLITRLEEALGVRLFDRTTRTVQLTAAGLAFLEQARRVRAQLELAERAMKDLVQLQEGRVTVAALPSLAANVVPSAFARYAALHPGIRLKVIDTLSGPAFDLVRAGEVDFALTAANPAYEDLDYAPIASDGFVLLIPPGHPEAAAVGKPLKWADTTKYSHISMPPPTSVRQYAASAFLELGILFEPVHEVEHLATIQAMVAAGLGVAALPALAADVSRPAGSIQRRLTTPSISRPIGLVTQRGRSLSPAAAAMVKLLREEVDKLGLSAGGRAQSRNTRPETSTIGKARS
jgi:LysR family transcriptional regulator, carnitine catabolism transcriptional activator